MLKAKKIKLRTTDVTTEKWDEEKDDYIEVTLCSSEVKEKMEELLTEARKNIAEAAKIANKHKIEFRPLGDLFSSDEIESQGWSSSNC